MSTMSGASAARFLHASNAVTYGALLAALLAVATAGAPATRALSGALLALAVLADTFDGRFARLFARTAEQRAFGAQLDSLVDAVAFGAAPVLILALQLGSGPAGPLERTLFWVCALFFAVCAVTRLGYYNLAEDSSGFTGLPAPVAALVVSTSMLVPLPAGASAVVLAACGVAMVSRWRIARPGVVGLTIFAAWAVGLVTVHGARALA